VTADRYSLAVVLSSGEPERLYTGLSLLVSAAVDRERCAALATFRGLGLLCAPDLRQLAMQPEQSPELAPNRRDTFARSLDELRDTAFSLETLDLYACSASVDLMTVDTARFAGVLSMPRFLQATAGARLVAL
jgi:peroxiredoxin family protein